MVLASQTIPLFDGLPWHPLVVHAAVVIFPLALLGLLAIIAVPRLRPHLGWAVSVLLVAGTISLFTAKETGEQLAMAVGDPEQHSMWADILVPVGTVTAVVGIAWWLLEAVGRRRRTRSAAVLDAPTHVDDLPPYDPEGYRPAGGVATATAPAATAVSEKPRSSALVRALAVIAAVLSLVSMVLTGLTGHEGAKAAWGDQPMTITQQHDGGAN